MEEAKKLSENVGDVSTDRIAGQNSSNSGRNWDQEVVAHLDYYYKGWRELSETFMVPYEFPSSKHEPNVGEPNNGKKTEERFFYLLKSFGKSRSEPMFVVHSQEFRELISEWNETSMKMEKKWLKGEHDFVVIHRHWGVIFFQVKGAQKTSKIFNEGKKQIDKDKQALRAYIERNVQGKTKKKIFQGELFSYPGFVVMPNCPYPDDSNVATDVGVFKEDCADVEAFSKWWKRCVETEHRINQEVFEFFVKRFVGLVCGIPCILNDSIELIKSKLEGYMVDELKNNLDSPPEQWISGPCGNGKTWLLIHKVQEIAEETDETVLVVCFSKPLSMKLANALKFEKVKVLTFEDLLLELSEHDSFSEQVGEGRVDDVLERLEEGTVEVQCYDHIFVLECEDLDGDKWPTLFKKLCKDDEEKYGRPKHIWFLYDPNQYVSQRYVKHLHSLVKGTKLSRIYKNTTNISKLAMKYFKGVVAGAKPPQPGHTICGPRIEWDDSLTSRDDKEDAGAKLIEKHIKDFRRNKVMDKEICILTENEDVRNSIILELKKIHIQSQNATDHHKNGEDKVVVESIRQFKELSSDVVVLYNPPYSEDTKWTEEHVKSLLYIAISCCVCMLVVITTKSGCEALQSEEGMTCQSEGSSSQKTRAEDVQPEL